MTDPSRNEQSAAENYPRHVQMLGVRVHLVQMPDVIRWMEEQIAHHRGSHFIAVTGMHGLTEAQRDPSFKKILNAADLVVPDGMPLVWLARWKGASLKRRVYGPELMITFCEGTAKKGFRHYFYGGAPGVAKELGEMLASRYPGVRVAGTFSPPFRSLNHEENRQILEAINQSRSDVLWVGLSTPKQERWMFENRSSINVPVLVGVGAAFDLNTGRVKQAPRWMREHGWEWLYRLLQEPRRLWRRYLFGIPLFLTCVILEALGLKKCD
jgi:N-acetylglucosaminyldiphosphoundecaprenol N-acetyl-beta-D-mannosaminyltransferase